LLPDALVELSLMAELPWRCCQEMLQNTALAQASHWVPAAVLSFAFEVWEEAAS
jgi:hypothetical protein